MTLAFVVLLLLALVPAGCVTLNTSPSSVANTTTPSVSPAGMETYQNTSLGVKFSYPREWETKVFNDSQAGTYYAVRPYFDSMLGCQMQFYALKNPYVSSNKSDAALNHVNQGIAAFKKRSETNNAYFSNFKLIQGPTRITLADEPAWKFTASYTFPLDAERSERDGIWIWTTHGNNLYGIAYSGPPQDYNRHLGTAQQIIDSFEFI